VLRAVSWTLRQRRYAALAAFMAVLAVACAAAGTFEVHRYHEKRHDNAVLIANIHAPTVPLGSAAVPLTGRGPAPDADAVRYRTVSATGEYDAAQQEYVGNVEQGGRRGFYVLAPLRMQAGTLLVLRGFVAATADGTRPAQVPGPPAGAVTVTGRLHDVHPAGNQQGRLGHGEITAIDASQQSRRLGTPVFQTYLQLAPRQPGGAGLSTLPAPPQHNPTSGASEWQLLSYVVQWYAFALLALVAPFLFSRAEAREARRRFLGVEPGAEQFDADADVERSTPALGNAASAGGMIAVRSRGEVAERADADVRWQRAARLADRYGVSLGEQDGLPSPAAARAAVARRHASRAADATVRDSSAAPHRSQDAYHGAYNDYLWQLALADGGLPDVFAGPDADQVPPEPLQRPRTVEVHRTIEVPPLPDEPEQPADGR
jgi:cytochrome oxidase assembly protein ShyY1